MSFCSTFWKIYWKPRQWLGPGIFATIGNLWILLLRKNPQTVAKPFKIGRYFEIIWAQKKSRGIVSLKPCVVGRHVHCVLSLTGVLRVIDPCIPPSPEVPSCWWGWWGFSGLYSDGAALYIEGCYTTYSYTVRNTVLFPFCGIISTFLIIRIMNCIAFLELQFQLKG